MTTSIKRIAVMTSGGDCAGLNAAIRAVVLSSHQLGWEVIGIESGWDGLMARPPRARVLGPEDVNTFMMRQGGTVLATTNRGNPFVYRMSDDTLHDASAQMIEGFRMINCDALIGIGGDGSLRILSRMAEQGGFPVVGIPKTIDNDVCMTEISLGFDTAVMVATEALDRLQPTASSHSRIMVLEVMGRDAGHIALEAGIAGGADVILIPEIPYNIQVVADHINGLRQKGHNFALVVVSEAVQTPQGENVEKDYFGGQKRLGGIGHIIGEQISSLCHAETRVTVLGHVQRGGQPSAQDRLIASAFGVGAVQLIREGKFGHMVAWSNRQVVSWPIAEVIKGNQEVDVEGDLVKTARSLGICLGNS